MPKPARLHHILRIDNEINRTHCWRVTVQRQHALVLQHFSDKPYGGKRKALQAAIACRDALLEQMQDESYGLWRRNHKRANNTSGIVGVGRYASNDVVGGEVVARASWQAFWDDADGRRRCRKFSVAKYGETKAKALAVATRKKAMADLKTR